jgi:hypothetical protein
MRKAKENIIKSTQEISDILKKAGSIEIEVKNCDGKREIIYTVPEKKKKVKYTKIKNQKGVK